MNPTTHSERGGPRRRLLAAAVLILAGAASAAPGAAETPQAAGPLTADFAVIDPGDVLVAPDADHVRAASVGGARVMQVSGGQARFRDVAVKPGVKYTFALDAAFEGDVESIEENPRFEIFLQAARTSPRLPMREIRFFDPAGRPVGEAIRYALPFRGRHRYQDVFHAPRGAALARILLTSGDGVRLAVAKAALTETPDEGALNVNPAFRLGPANYSGWSRIAAGGQLLQQDGRTILDTKYGSAGESIPLPGPGTYAISAKAAANGYNSVVIVRVYDAAGQKMMETSTRRYGPPTYFVPPPGAATASFLVYSCLLEEVRLVRAGDEDAINALRAASERPCPISLAGSESLSP